MWMSHDELPSRKKSSSIITSLEMTESIPGSMVHDDPFCDGLTPGVNPLLFGIFYVSEDDSSGAPYGGSHGD